MPHRYYLGVDGGQSSTTALIADETGEVLGAGTAGPCNHVSGDEARSKFESAVGHCISEACQEAGVAEDGSLDFAAACLGFSGGAQDKEEFSKELIRSARFKITHDAEIALSGAMEGEPGIIAIAGTGSIAFGRNEQGETARAGGWGYVFGDEGGAFDLVRRGLRAALRMEEGWGVETVLRSRLLEATACGSANELLHRFYAFKERKRFAALAPAITESAEAGDAVARTLITESAAALAQYVEGVYRKLFPGRATTRVAHIGGVFKSSIFRAEFTRILLSRISCTVGPPLLSPAAGALIEALRLDGNSSNLTSIREVKT